MRPFRQRFFTRKRSEDAADGFDGGAVKTRAAPMTASETPVL
jgi:hypothetical protein